MSILFSKVLHYKSALQFTTTMPTIDIITMGCSKNLVDSEHLMKQFEALGYTLYHNPDVIHGDIAVVNTCGFIGDAKEESINIILELFH